MIIVRFAIVLWTAVLLSGPAHASFDSARKYYAALDVPTRVKITLGLIATGDFDGLAALGFTRRYYKSVLAFQKREKFEQDGELGPDEIALLVCRFEEFSKAADVRPVRHPRTGSEALMPYALAGHPRNSRLGLIFERDDQKLDIEMAAFPLQERTYRGLFNAYTNTYDRRRIDTKLFRDDFFVVSGLSGGRYFYAYFTPAPDGSTGFFITSSKDWSKQGRQAAALMANSFIAKSLSPTPPGTDQPPPPAAAAPQQPPPKPQSGTGTAFRITSEGHVLTNYHVAGQCKTLRLHKPGEPPVEAVLVGSDSVNDLALLKAASLPQGAIAKFAGNWATQAGSDIIVFGFPYSGLLSDGGNVVTGNVTALSGLGNDSRLYQISAPVQPGNSGGPVLDRKGGVIAVIVSKLDAMKVAEKTGDVPQNVNFAIKSSVVLNFIEGTGVKTEQQSPPPQALDTPALAEQARGFTFLVECNND